MISEHSGCCGLNFNGTLTIVRRNPTNVVNPVRRWSPQREARTVDNVGTAIEAPIVQVVIVTWNKEKDVMRLLHQLKYIDYPENNYEMTVVDNNSSDNTIQSIESAHPSVHLIRNQENAGGAGGFNTGMRWVLQNRRESKYMWLLDNDVLVDSNTLKELVAIMEDHPGTGICGSRIMNIAEPNEVLEVGAFIDYRLGRSRRNVPGKSQVDRKKGVFEVDYVSACSLLVRNDCVTELGLLNDDLFIYWDDKEWGARFNAFGYKVLACNASVVYHPDWAGGRIADNSAVWRTYYATRNCLWFYNTYTSGIKRRLLLTRIIMDWMGFALAACMSARLSPCRATVTGIEDFFNESYGKKDFQVPDENIAQYFSNHKVKEVCVFVPNGMVSERAERFVLDLAKSFPGTTILSIVPAELQHTWAKLSEGDNIMPYRRSSQGTIRYMERLRIVKFLLCKSWDILLIPPPSLRVAGLSRRDVAIVDFDKGTVLSIERMQFADLFHIPFRAFSFLMQALVCPPQSGPGWAPDKHSHL
jgi:GT2 family glycosyltransferase